VDNFVDEMVDKSPSPHPAAVLRWSSYRPPTESSSAGRIHWFGGVVASFAAACGLLPEREEGGYLIDGFTQAR
jgi:hypothetical protein